MAEVSVQEASARLGVSEQYVLRMLSETRLVGRRKGRTWAIEESSVAALAATRTPARSRARTHPAAAPGSTAPVSAAREPAQPAQPAAASAGLPPRPMPTGEAGRMAPVTPGAAPQEVEALAAASAETSGGVLVPAPVWAAVVAERDRLRAAVGQLSAVVAELAGAPRPV